MNKEKWRELSAYRPSYVVVLLGDNDIHSLSDPLAISKRIWPRGYKTFSILNSAEHKNCPAHKC